jgi:hypothetical protein
MQHRAVVLVLTLLLGSLPAGTALAPGEPHADLTVSPDAPPSRAYGTGRLRIGR